MIDILQVYKDGFEINITNYSDCFFITLESLSENYQPTLSSFVEFVSIIGMIQLFIFLETQNHFTLKGYLTYGSCTNTPDLVYGEALVECANKEKEIKEPRIEISKKAFDLFGLERNNFSNYELKNCILKVNDTLGTTIVDPFSSMNPEQQVASAELLSKLINRASKTEHAFKVLWLIACFVSHCDFSISTKDKTLLNDYSGLSRLLNTFN